MERNMDMLSGLEGCAQSLQCMIESIRYMRSGSIVYYSFKRVGRE